LVQFKKKQQDQWTQGMQCYWCWKLGHNSSDCSRRQAGQPKLPKPGSTITCAPGGGGNNNNNNNNDGGGKTQASRCTRCKGHQHTKKCYHDPANAAKRPKDWVVGGGGKKEFGTVSIDSIDRPVDRTSVHKPDFSIIAIEHDHKSSTELKPDFSLVAIYSLTVPPSRLVIDTQLLQIQDRVNNGDMSFPDNFELLYDKNVWIFDTGASCNSSGCMDGAINI
jgi:hypothetical protein